MKVLLDLNVLMDYLFQRDDVYVEATQIVDTCFRGVIRCLIPAHAVTTVAYYKRKVKAVDTEQLITWLLAHFEVVECDAALLGTACSLAFRDYEDAVVSAAAARANCIYIVTRNTKDFDASTVPAITPAAFLQKIFGSQA